MSNQLIGRFTTDLEYVYALPNHELYREWVGLVDTTEVCELGSL